MLPAPCLYRLEMAVEMEIVMVVVLLEEAAAKLSLCLH